MLTLNQTIEIFKNFSLRHKSLGKNQTTSNFYFGDPWEVDASFAPTYPFMLVTLLPTAYDKSGLITRKFQIDISDKVKLDETNENHVLSDVEQICFDLFNYLEQLADSGDIGINIGNVSELTDYTEGRDDSVSGWYFTIELKSHQQETSCNLPIFNGNILDSNYVYVGNQYNQECGNFVVQIKDQSGNILETFNTSGEYVVTVLSGIRDTITSNITTITDDLI
jgi:hypothetical protein